MCEIYDAKKAFLKKIKYNDDRIDYFEKNYDKWMDEIPEEVRPIIELLLTYFDYYSHRRVNEYLEVLHEKILKEYNVQDEEALHTFLKKKDGNLNSSMEYFMDYRNINLIDKGYCYDDIRCIAPDEWGNIENIIIVDDCCGTGGSLKKFLANMNLDFRGKTIYYIVIHAMQLGKENLDIIAKKFNTKIELVAMNIREKAFSIEALGDYKNTICEFSRSKGLNEKYWLGIDESEALLAFYNNTPNNTIGLFWESNGDYQAIFPRFFKKIPAWKKRPTPNSMKKGKMDRKARNYNARNARNNNERLY